MRLIWMPLSFVIIDNAGRYRLSLADGDEDPARDLRGGLANPRHLALNPGDYYIHIRTLDNPEGGDFGLSLIQE